MGKVLAEGRVFAGDNRRQRRNATKGLISSLFGCIFGFTSVFVFAVIFVPLSALCSLIGLLRARRLSIAGIALVGFLLASAGFVTSPVLMVLAGTALILTPSLSDLPKANESPPAKQQIARQVVHPTPIPSAPTALDSSEISVGSTCYMGECFRQAIVRSNKLANGVIEIRVRTEKFQASHPVFSLQKPEYALMWVSCRQPDGYLHTDQDVRYQQPNTNPSHASEPIDNVWKAACRG